jgi:hypothetical protein
MVVLLLGGVLAVAGCGGSSDSSGSTTATESTSVEETTTGEDEESEDESEDEEEATPEEAVEEIGEIRTALDAAVEKYRSGDQEGAADDVGDVYLDHFEKVEGPLGDRNHDLMEELEEKLSTDLRKAMDDGEPVEEIEQMVTEIDSELDRAVTELE